MKQSFTRRSTSALTVISFMRARRHQPSTSRGKYGLASIVYVIVPSNVNTSTLEISTRCLFPVPSLLYGFVEFTNQQNNSQDQFVDIVHSLFYCSVEAFWPRNKNMTSNVQFMMQFDSSFFLNLVLTSLQKYVVLKLFGNLFFTFTLVWKSL